MAKLRIVHFSDWHGEARELPAADLYVCTGDMYPDPYGYQSRESRDHQATWRPELRAKFASPEAPIVAVRGNHDLWPLFPIFGGAAPVYEVSSVRDVYNVLGLRVGGFYGVRAISRTRGPVLEQDGRLEERVAGLDPDLDLLITHMPSAGVLDHDGYMSYGHDALRRWVLLQQPKLHCHGHIHEAAGMDRLLDTVVSNAATTHHVIDL